MPSERRRIRSRLYERKRRLRRQVLAGKITQAQAETILAAYSLSLGVRALADAVNTTDSGVGKNDSSSDEVSDV